MLISPETIAAAFRKHEDVYNSQKIWSIPYHVECWRRATRAFDGPDFAEFEWIYNELKGRWQVFRGSAAPPWSVRKAFEHLTTMDSPLRGASLRDFSDEMLHDCREIIRSMESMKPLKKGASVVAISKFLHFWNPRLFVIVDDAVVWKWVFRHRWLRDPVLGERDRIGALLNESHDSSSPDACDPLSYLAVLRWSADLIRENQCIPTAFASYVRSHVEEPQEMPAPESLESAAVEWLLLGLVELQPVGVADS